MANTADALVVGGGIIGLSIAHRLATSGLEVAVLDRGDAGLASPAAGGMLSTPLHNGDGEAFLELCLQSRRLYPELVQTLREQTDIDVEYLPWGALELLSSAEQRAERSGQVAELRKLDLGFELVDAAELRKLEPQLCEQPFGAVLLSDDHHLNNEELLRALRQACLRLDVRVHERCEVRRLLRKGDHVLGAETSQGYFTAAEVVMAAGCWSGALMEGVGLALPVRPVRGQMLAVRSELSVRHILYTHDGYVVPRLSGELLVGSTLEEAGFRVANTLAGVASLSAMALRLSPSLAEAEISRTWAGLRPGTPDGLPLLGRCAGVRGLIVATGHYRHGILLTPITARLVAELLLEGTTSIDLTPFSASRFDPPAA
jgi:glycine oxidase